MMRFSVSNIAWSPDRDPEVASILRNSVITGIEIAPSRYFADVGSAPESQFVDLGTYWLNLGFPVTSLQSLLYNRPDLQLFESEDSRVELKSFLLELGKKAALLGAGPLVFGAPKNRNRGHLTNSEATSIAKEFFKSLSEEWPQNSSFLVLEANPEIYGCNFITKSSEAFEFVKTIGSEKLKWHLDLACTELGNESSQELIINSEILPSHIHLSEANLAPLVDSKTPVYRDFLLALKSRGYDGVVTLEMRETDNMDDLKHSIEILNGVEG
jgi:sugar phosphate isomerase/epimerase